MFLSICRSSPRALRWVQFSTTSSRTFPSTSAAQVLLQRPSPLTVSTCYLRTRGGHGGHHEKTSEWSDTDSQKSDENHEEKEQGEQQKKKEIDPALARKLRMYVLAVGGLSFVTSFFLLAQMFKEGTGLPEGTSTEHFNRPGMELNVFVQKYLRTGEVRNIVFCPQVFKAVAYLHDGAIIDGQKPKESFVVISYAHNAQQFWADIRKEEAQLGISLSNGVPITMYQGMTTWNVVLSTGVVELVIGLLIIAWLGTQYGRLLRQRILANKKAGPPPPPSQ